MLRKAGLSDVEVNVIQPIQSDVTDPKDHICVYSTRAFSHARDGDLQYRPWNASGKRRRFTDIGLPFSRRNHLGSRLVAQARQQAPWGWSGILSRTPGDHWRRYSLSVPSGTDPRCLRILAYADVVGAPSSLQRTGQRGVPRLRWTTRLALSTLDFSN
jgi:hypothetical protein